MERQELIRAMMKSVDGASFITATQVMRFLGVKNSSRVKTDYLQGLEHVGTLYFIPDVVGRITQKAQEDYV